MKTHLLGALLAVGVLSVVVEGALPATELLAEACNKDEATAVSSLAGAPRFAAAAAGSCCGGQKCPHAGGVCCPATKHCCPVAHTCTAEATCVPATRLTQPPTPPPPSAPGAPRTGKTFMPTWTKDGPYRASLPTNKYTDTTESEWRPESGHFTPSVHEQHKAEKVNAEVLMAARVRAQEAARARGEAVDPEVWVRAQAPYLEQPSHPGKNTTHVKHASTRRPTEAQAQQHAALKRAAAEADQQIRINALKAKMLADHAIAQRAAARKRELAATKKEIDSRGIEIIVTDKDDMDEEKRAPVHQKAAEAGKSHWGQYWDAYKKKRLADAADLEAKAALAHANSLKKATMNSSRRARLALAAAKAKARAERKARRRAARLKRRKAPKHVKCVRIIYEGTPKAFCAEYTHECVRYESSKFKYCTKWRRKLECTDKSPDMVCLKFGNIPCTRWRGRGALKRCVRWGLAVKKRKPKRQPKPITVKCPRKKSKFWWKWREKYPNRWELCQAQPKVIQGRRVLYKLFGKLNKYHTWPPPKRNKKKRRRSGFRRGWRRRKPSVKQVPRLPKSSTPRKKGRRRPRVVKVVKTTTRKKGKVVSKKTQRFTKRARKRKQRQQKKKKRQLARRRPRVVKARKSRRVKRQKRRPSTRNRRARRASRRGGLTRYRRTRSGLSRSRSSRRRSRRRSRRGRRSRRRSRRGRRSRRRGGRRRRR